MRCAECKFLCKGKVYDSHLEAMEIQFANIISQIIAGVKVKRNKKQMFVPDVHGHRSDLCEACQSGLCMAKRTLDSWKAEEMRTKSERFAKYDKTKPKRKSSSESD